MALALNSVRMRLASVSCRQRVGLLPMAVALGLAFAFVIIWYVIAIFVYQYNAAWSIILIASTSAFLGVIALMASRLVGEAFRDYVFELNDTEAVLTVTDRWHKKRSTQMVLLDDVKFAEYYPFQDSSCLILHAPYIDMEVPLWPMGGRSNDVIDFLAGRGVRVVNVQSDDRVPD